MKDNKKSRRHFIKAMGATALVPLLPDISLGAVASMTANTLRILSCNIRVALPEDDAQGVGWRARKQICIDVIRSRRPDIVCFQEVLSVQAQDIKSAFDQYLLFGFEGPEMDQYPDGYHGIAKNPILFSKTRFDLLTGGTYWLSETPLIGGSKSWNTARARHLNWVRLMDKSSGHEFRIANLHLDHISDEARIAQSEMVARESAQYLPGFTQILTGDFNSRYNSKVMQPLRDGGWKESYETVHGFKEAGFTGHEFKGVNHPQGPSKGRIDFIWYRGSIKPIRAEIVKDAVNGQYPSDHFFIQTDFEIQ